MKKLLLLSAFATAALMANSATMKWASGTMSLPSGAESDMNITGYLFSLSAIDYAKITSADYVWSTYGSQLASATVSGKDDLGDLTLSDPSNYSSGDSAYAAIIYKTTEAEQDYYIANYGTYSFTSSSDKKISNMGLLLNGSGAALEWQSVPEPFSGTLALLGMIGIGLRKKFRKAKKA